MAALTPAAAAAAAPRLRSMALAHLLEQASEHKEDRASEQVQGAPEPDGDVNQRSAFLRLTDRSQRRCRRSTESVKKGFPRF